MNCTVVRDAQIIDQVLNGRRRIGLPEPIEQGAGAVLGANAQEPGQSVQTDEFPVRAASPDDHQVDERIAPIPAAQGHDVPRDGDAHLPRAANEERQVEPAVVEADQFETGCVHEPEHVPKLPQHCGLIVVGDDEEAAFIAVVIADRRHPSRFGVEKSAVLVVGVLRCGLDVEDDIAANSQLNAAVEQLDCFGIRGVCFSLFCHFWVFLALKVGSSK